MQDDFIIQAGDICMASPEAPFSTHWEARIPVPLATIKDMGRSLQRRFATINPGDLVNVTAYSDKHYRRVTEIASFRIVAKEDGRLYAVQVSETVKVPEPKPAAASDNASRLEVVTLGKAHEVRDHLNNTIEVFVDRAQAEAFVAQANGTAASSGGGPAKREAYTVKRGFAGKWRVVNEADELVREFATRAEAEAFAGMEPKAA